MVEEILGEGSEEEVADAGEALEGEKWPAAAAAMVIAAAAAAVETPNFLRECTRMLSRRWTFPYGDCNKNRNEKKK